MRTFTPQNPPSSLERFGQCITELSEPPSGPPADNLVTNEDSFTRPAAELAARVPRPSAYLGVGPDQNFTLIAHARPSLAFITDYRRRNLLLHLLHKALFALAPDRPTYLQLLCARRATAQLTPDPTPAQLVAAFHSAPFERALLEESLAQVARYLQPIAILEPADFQEIASIHTRLARAGLAARFLPIRGYPTLAQLIPAQDRNGQSAHHLASNSLFQSVRNAQLQHRILPLVGNYAGARTLPRLARWCQENQLPIGLLYVSDMEWFLIRNQQFTTYLQNLERLPRAPGALILRTSTRPLNHPQRQPPDQCTSFLEPLEAFLARARHIHPFTADDLFPRDSPMTPTPTP